MKPAVLGYFRRYTKPLEGDVPWMYLDVKGLVTVGNGNLLATSADAKKLPFRWRDSKRPASAAEIENEWNSIKAYPALARLGHTAAEKVARLELSDGAIGYLVKERLLVNEIALCKHRAFSHWNAFPADAQLAFMSLAWAVGVGKIFSSFPRLMVAARELDFAGCARECEIDTTGNPGIAPRNTAQKICFKHAERVVLQDLDREYLNFPDAIKEVA